MRQAKFTKQFTLSFSSQTFQRIKDISDRDNLSMAEVLRDIVDLGLVAWDKKPNNNQVIQTMFASMDLSK